MPQQRTPMAKPCAHYPECVGCPLIGTAYGEQLRIKHERVTAALREYTRLAGVAADDVIGSPRAFGYRNQAKLVARRTQRGLLLGIYKPGTHQVVDIRECPVHHPLIPQILTRAAALIEQLEVPTYDERNHSGVLRYLVVRVSNWAKRAQVIVVTYPRSWPRQTALLRALERVPGVESVVHNINESPGNVILGPENRPVGRVATLTERVGDWKLASHAGAFLQANIPVARKLYDHAVAEAQLGPEDIVTDLYCGVGALTFFLATRARTVFGIEESPVAVPDAKANVRLNGFHNVRFQCAAAADGLAELAQRLPRIDVVTLNPPRKGADAATRSAILAASPRRIVYVSCDPRTLAHDLDWFAEHGYRTERLQPYDMLPQTEHIECVATLVRVGH